MKFATLRNMVLFLMFLYVTESFGQCGTTINTFPYIENFETSAAWTTGGPTNSLGTVVNDWAWGTPNKPVINSAGSGRKCWVVGGLNGLTYGSGERSYIQSPCFDFTNLAHPYITFLIFRESEWKYDGAVLQYSTNGGSSWSNLGAYTDPVDCLDSNWYNYNNVLGLKQEVITGNTYPALSTNGDGWCGNIQATAGNCQGGHGTGGWVLARHCMASLAGLPSVKFRFAFGAGTTCNTFDGFAVDSISIREAPANTADFNYTCVNTNTLAFSGITTLCPTTFAWNFSDPGSGANNTSSALSPSHSFSAPGTYDVTFTTSGGCNAPGTVTKTITIIGDTITKADISCFGASDATATVVASGASGYSYAWSTTPVQTTPTISNLSAGTYTVSVNATGVCQATASVVINQPAALSHTIAVTSPSCSATNGSIIVHETGGTPGYTYTWNPAATGDTLTNLIAGTYNVTITDQHGCRDSLTAVITSSSTLNIKIDSTNISCHNKNDGIAYAVVTGQAPIHYAWSNQSTTDTITNLGAGMYTVTVTDGSGCLGTAAVNIINPDSIAAMPVLTSDTCSRGIGSIAVSTTGGTSPYHYIWSPAQPGNPSQLSALAAGVYALTVTDAIGCSVTEAYTIDNSCMNDSIVFPTAFSPNGDNKNEIFLPVYIGVIANYQLNIYNRWGQLVFESTDPSIGWNGTYKNAPQPTGVYTYFASYTDRKPEQKQGTFTLLR